MWYNISTEARGFFGESFGGEEFTRTEETPSATLRREDMSMWYDFTKIDGYNCPVKIVVSRRGLGKTFGKLKYCTERFVTKKSRFIYVVETGEMVKQLTMNNGEKFWKALLEYYGQYDTARKRYFYNRITELKAVDIADDDPEGTKVLDRKIAAKIVGGTIKINGDTAGYILDMNSFGELKRNNFNGVDFIFVDEFISEKLDKNTLQNPRKLSSIIQSVARLRYVKIYMFGNAVRFDDPILSRMGFKIDHYGFYKKYDKNGLFAVLHFVDPRDYPDFAKAHEKSVAGRFASLIGETNEEENKFLSDLPEERRLNTFAYKKGGWNLSVVKDNTIVTLKELKNGNIACVPFANSRCKNLYCLNEREQGFKLGFLIIYNMALRKTIAAMMRADIIYYYSEVEYNQLRIIMKGD